MDKNSKHMSQAVPNLVLATLEERIAAFAIDMLILFGFAVCLVVFLKTYAFSESEQHHIFMYTAPIFLLYSLLFESLNHGRSLGKYFLKIRVLKEEGTVGSFVDYSTRWLFRFLDVYISMGIFAVILIIATDKNQRLGDLIAKTVVVKD